MSKTELKEKLIGQISKTEDETLLMEVYRLLETGGSMEENIYILNDEQIAIVEESRAQFKRGEFLTDEEADKELDEWLGK